MSSLKRDSFSSVADLEQAIAQYIEHHNKDPKPFVWTASAADILAKVTRAKAALAQVARYVQNTLARFTSGRVGMRRERGQCGKCGRVRHGEPMAGGLPTRRGWLRGGGTGRAIGARRPQQADDEAGFSVDNGVGDE